MWAFPKAWGAEPLLGDCSLEPSALSDQFPITHVDKVFSSCLFYTNMFEKETESQNWMLDHMSQLLWDHLIKITKRCGHLHPLCAQVIFGSTPWEVTLCRTV